MRKFTNGKGITAEFDEGITEEILRKRLSWLMPNGYYEVKENGG